LTWTRNDPIRQTMPLDTQRTQHRLWTLVLTGGCVALIVILTVIVPLFTTAINSYRLLEFPAGYYLMAEGAIVIFVVLIFWAAGRQERLDRKLGAAEDH
jgi:putative solute:sodium symporter small subunit